MTNEQIGKWLSNLKDDMGQTQHRELWHYAEALDMAIEALSNSQNQSESLIRTSADAVSEADAINRQQAINALEKDEEYNKDIPIRADGIRDAIITISTLPSAQPEVIRCRDCCHYPGEHADCPMTGWHRNGDDFCSFAERRTDG